MTEEELEALVGAGEDSRVDRKRSLRLDTLWHRTEFVKDVMAFANGHEPLTAYVLVGVDNDGGLHDVGDTLPDEATLQQIVASHLEPTVAFALKMETLRGVRLGVIEIPPSDERFHVAAKDVNGPNNKPLLRQGEILIRRGTAKMPPRALDFKQLKEAWVKQGSPQLDVRFAGDSDEIKTVRGWPIPERVLRRVVTHFVVPPSRLADIQYQFIPLRFFVHNRGRHQAEGVVVEVSLPEGCQAVAAPPDERNRQAWRSSVERPANRVRIEGDRLVHGDSRWSRDVYVRFFRRDWRYTLEWTARAGNAPTATHGILCVEVMTNSQ